MYQVTVLPQNQTLIARGGENLLEFLRSQGILLDAPCGGQGKCGKCRVTLYDGPEEKQVLACQQKVEEDLVISLPGAEDTRILERSQEQSYRFDPVKPGYQIAIDIGTTTVVCYLLDREDGRELAVASCRNPQGAYGADVISRIQYSLRSGDRILTDRIRETVEKLIREVCSGQGVEDTAVGVVSVVANPCMEQLFLGIPVDNLAAVPFAPVIHRTGSMKAGEVLSVCRSAELLVIPEISGYVGADTLGCLLAVPERFYEKTSLLIDIGTNGEMALSHQGKLYTCSTAAGPALEGARITMGMRGAPGAIDHVQMENGRPRVHVIGDREAEGICGSGLIDGAAFLLNAGILNQRGRMKDAAAMPELADLLEPWEGERACRFTSRVCLTQQDIRELQLAKGAIAAGVDLMLQNCGIGAEAVDGLYLAGAFGSFLDPVSACRIGLLPPVLLDRVHVLGNAAGSGAKLLARDRSYLERTDRLMETVTFLELAELPDFRMSFARNMNFKV